MMSRHGHHRGSRSGQRDTAPPESVSAIFPSHRQTHSLTPLRNRDRIQSAATICSTGDSQGFPATAMPYSHTVRGVQHCFADLRTLLAKASPLRSGDQLAGIAASGAEERAVAQMTLADLPLSVFQNEAVVPYESDAVTRLIVDTQDKAAFAPIADLTVGEFRDWLLSDEATGARIAELADGLIPEMAAAVSKLMRAQDLIYVARKISVVTQFRTTVGLPGTPSTRLQPNHPTDDPVGIAASILDGLLLGSGDAVIGINPASDSVGSA